MDWTSRESIRRDLAGRHPAVIEVAQWFANGHLQGPPRDYSNSTAAVADYMISALPDSPELTSGLRKLLEAKDCFVRAAIAVSDG